MQYTLTANQTLSIPTHGKKYAAIALISDLGEIRYKQQDATLIASTKDYNTLNTNVRTDYLPLSNNDPIQIRAISASTIQIRMED